MYIGAIPTPAATESRQEFTATANQTVFNTTGGTVGYCDCYLNGVKMANSDFSFDGADVTLTTGAAAGDVLAVVLRQADSALVALPIKDSAGNNVLSEAGGVVTLAHNIIDGNSSYGFAHFKLSSSATFPSANAQKQLNFATQVGDTTNITKPSSNHVIRLGIRGIYLIIFGPSFALAGGERYFANYIRNASDDSVYSEQYTGLAQADNSTTYSSATVSYVGYFSGNTDGSSDIYCSSTSGNDGNATIDSNSFLSIVLLRKTA